MFLPEVTMKNPPQTQLHIHPRRQKAVVSNCNNPIPKLRQQLENRSPDVISSLREQQKLLNPAHIVPAINDLRFSKNSNLGLYRPTSETPFEWRFAGGR